MPAVSGRLSAVSESKGMGVFLSGYELWGVGYGQRRFCFQRSAGSSAGGGARYAAVVMQTVKAIYPGTFDPLTNGHLDLIARGAKIVDELVVAILRNADKGVPLFTVPERVEMIAEAIAGAGFKNVTVTTFDGLLVEFARAQGAKAVLRGIRAISDYEYEFQMAMMNRKLDPELETLFMMPAEKYTYVSSRLIKGVFKLGGDVSALVPPLVMERLKAKG
jgi:pantetheine-phosphate adenylyltransferase